VWGPLGGALRVAFAAGCLKRGCLDGVADLLQGGDGLDFRGNCLGVVEDPAEGDFDGWECGEEFGGGGEHVLLLLGGDLVGGTDDECGDVQPFQRG